MPGPRRMGLLVLCLAALAAAFLVLREPSERVGNGIDGLRTAPAEPPGAPNGGARGADRMEFPGKPLGTSSECVVTVVSDLGAPVAAAYVALFQDDRLLSTGRTEGDGTVGLTGATEPSSIAIFPIDAGAFVGQLTEPSGDVTVRLPTLAVVSGRVEIDGKAPGQPVTVAVVVQDFSRLPAVWSSAVERWITGEVRHQPWLQTCVTDSEGRFRFAGLPSGTPLFVWSWRLSAAVETEDSRGGLLIEAPVTDLVVKFRRRAGVTGRVVASGTTRGAPGAQVLASLSTPAGSVQPLLAVAAEDGTFFLAVPKTIEAVDPVSMKVMTARNSGLRVFEMPLGRLRSGESLGDLELSPTRLVSYRVTDEAGKPVVGAFVAAVDRGIGSTSLQDGSGVIEVPLGDVELIAGALGFRSTTVLAAESVAGVLPIVLGAASVLSVHVKSQDGGRLTNGVEIRVQSDRPLFEGEPMTWWEWPRSETLVLPNNVRTEGAPGTLIVLESTTAKLSSVRADAHLQITARDSLSGAQAAQSVVLAEGEAKTIELRLPRKARTVRGRVSAADGTPVYRGLPRLMPLSRRDDVVIECDTARDGTFLFEDVLADRALLYVEGTSWIKELSIPEDGLYVDVRLEPAQEAAVEVLDDQNRPVSSVEVLVRAGAFLGQDYSTSDEGKVRVHPVPSGEVLIEARYGNVDASLTARVPGPTAVLHLPPHGSVEFEGWTNLRTVRLEPIGAMKAIELKDGQTSMRGISPGRYRARIDCWTDDEMNDSATVAEREIVVKNGETTTIRFNE